MIAYLRGTLIESLPHRVVLEVSGVGYEVQLPTTCFDDLPAIGQEVKLLTHHHVREQSEDLYGFLEKAQKDLFALLINRVSGIGPKLALSILSGMKVGQFQEAVMSADVASLSKINGLGKKTAERIVVELKDKVGIVEAWENLHGGEGSAAGGGAINDTILALISLGYKQAEASKILQQLEKSGGISASDSSEEMLRVALKTLR